MTIRTLSLVTLAVVLLGVAGCATTPEQRGPWHEYLHEHGLE